jgi:D-glycero-D-manno-heptose 1,7-bisphosphate phosphatase
MIHTNKDWTLFLDRDGVINVEKINDYILRWEDFKFYEGVPEALSILNKLFNRIVIVTNQRCIGKGTISAEAIENIHRKMVTEIEKNDGRIDKVYVCGDFDTESYSRKPNPGMAFQAKQDFPEIDFARSIIIGNNLSDMEFGKRLKMKTIFISSTQEAPALPHPMIDEVYRDLISAASHLKTNKF